MSQFRVIGGQAERHKNDYYASTHIEWTAEGKNPCEGGLNQFVIVDGSRLENTFRIERNPGAGEQWTVQDTVDGFAMKQPGATILGKW